MLRTAVWGVALMSLLFSLPSFAQRSYHSYSQDHRVVTLKLEQYRMQMYQLNMLKVDIAGIDIARRLVDVNITDKELQLIQKYIPTAKVVAQETTFYGGIGNGRRRGPDKSYYDLAKVELRLKQLQQQYPSIMATSVIGKSLQGRNIYAVKISDNVAQHELAEPAILFNSMHHAREVMTTEVAMDTIEVLLGGYASNSQVRSYVDRNEIWVVPMVNVDGNHIVWNKDSMWRKNSRGGYGVDINRNYPYDWNACGGSSGSKSSQTYRGESAGSEPETQALMNLVAAIRPVFDISYHSYSELVIYPFGCKGKNTPQGSMVREIGREIALKLPTDSRQGYYTPGTSWEILYSVDGGDIDWMYGAYNVLPYVIELSSRREGFQPSYEKWRNKTVTKARGAWSHILDRVEGPGIRGFVQTAKRRKAEVAVEIKSLDNPSMEAQARRINPDGTFHFVLSPGSYQLTLSDGQLTKPPVAITVGAKRTEQTFQF